jgi:hypothetical protein
MTFDTKSDPVSGQSWALTMYLRVEAALKRGGPHDEAQEAALWRQMDAAWSMLTDDEQREITESEDE